jgi:hypothetical protein
VAASGEGVVDTLPSENDVSFLQYSAEVDQQAKGKALVSAEEDCTKQPNNQRDFLLPPEGSGWRGSTQGWAMDGQMSGLGYDDNADADPDTFAIKYGKPLHVYRLFKGKGNPGFPDENAFASWIERGGIVYYSIYDKDYAEIVSGSRDWAIRAWANKFKEVAPAKMFITMRYEPELYAVKSKDSGEFGHVKNHNGKYHFTPAQYREIWQYVWKFFKKEGVTNAVWAMDYSVDGGTIQEFLPLVAALWPGDEYVDWLFWNLFLFKRQRNHYDSSGSQFAYWLNHSYATFEAYSGVPLEWEGETYVANFKSAKGWGIGAWGGNHVKGWTHKDEAERVRFVADAKGPLNSGLYPRLKLMCYFDTIDPNSNEGSDIGNATWRQGGAFSATPMVKDGGPSNEDMFNAYRSMVDSDYFNVNDVPPPGPTTTTTTSTTTTTTTTTGKCQKWCYNKGPPTVCSWDACKGCDGC